MAKKDKLNYNYAFVFYDVNVKRCNKIFKICKKYLEHYQKSVFRGEITPSNMILFRNEIKNMIDENTDFVCIIKLMNNNIFGEEVLGNKTNDCESLFL